MASGGIEIISGRTLGEEEVLDNGKLNELGKPLARVMEGAITTRELAAGSITSDKLADKLNEQLGVPDGSVTEAKIVDGAVTTAKIAAGAVTNVKLDPSVIHGLTLLTDPLLDDDEIMVWDASDQLLKRVRRSILSPTGSIIQLEYDENLNQNVSLAGSISFAAPGPQINMGTQILTKTFTPKSADSLLRISYSVPLNVGAYSTCGAALFRNSVSTAIAASILGITGYGTYGIATTVKYELPGSVSPITYSVRASGRLNSDVGVGVATLTIEEIKRS